MFWYKHFGRTLAAPHSVKININVHHKGADMQYKEIVQILIAGVVVPVAVQVLNQLAQIYVDEATKKSKYTIRIG